MSEQQPEPAEGDDDTVYRLCIRVADNPFMTLLNPTAQLDYCSCCPNPIWVDAAQSIPSMVTIQPTLVCMHCALANENLRDTVIKMFPKAMIEYAVLGTVSAYNKDGELWVDPSDASLDEEADVDDVVPSDRAGPGSDDRD